MDIVIFTVMNFNRLLKKCSNAIRHIDIYNIFMYVTLFFFLMTCFISFYKTKISITYVNKYALLPLLIIIFIGLLRGKYFSKKLYILCLFFVGWIIISYLLRGDSLLNKNNFFVLLNRCSFCMVAIPFGHFMNDTKRRKYLDSFILITIILTAILLWLCYIGVLTGENISLFSGKYKFGASYTITGRIKLKVLNIHYYHLGYLSLMCFFGCLYLAVSHWTKRLMPICIFLLTTFGAGIIFTYSRTAIFTFIGGLLIAFYVLLHNMHFKKTTRILIFASISVLAILLAINGINGIYSIMHSIRDIWYGISTLSSRTTIWSCVIDIFADYPHALLSGFSLEDIVPMINSYLPSLDHVSHMHSGYLQTLLSLGLPGLMGVIAYSVYVTKSCLHILLSSHSDTFTNAEKVLTILPITCMVVGMFESTIFYNASNIEIFNLFTALFSGYIIDIVNERKVKQVPHE